MTATPCTMTARTSRDGRRYCSCGKLVNPAGYCTETGRRVGVDGWTALEGTPLTGELVADLKVTVARYTASLVTVPAGTRVTLLPLGADGTVVVNAAPLEAYAGGGHYGTAPLADVQLRADDLTATEVPTRDEVARYTDAELELSEEALEAAQDAAEADGDEELAVKISTARQHVEQEQDARALWNSDDARVRESVGNYRP